MKYSIIIPAYKCESTLEATVNSIQNCGLTDFEILLVDDGSPDFTPILCDRIAAKQNNVRCFHQPNGGVSSARNRGLSEAKGDYVWFFDSDDLVDSGSMKRATQIVEERSPDMLIFGMSFDYYHKGELYHRLEMSYNEEIEMTAEDVDAAFSKLYRSNSISSSCNKLLRRSILIEYHLEFDTSLFSYEDLHFVMKVLQHCARIYMLPQIIYRYIQPVDQPKELREKDHNRMARIKNTADYLTAFEPFLKNHQDVLIDLYYLMIQEKLRKQTPREIQNTAEEYRSGPYSTGELFDKANANQKHLGNQLISGNAVSIYASNLKKRIRSVIAGSIKKTKVFQVLRGQTTFRI